MMIHLNAMELHEIIKALELREQQLIDFGNQAKDNSMDAVHDVFDEGRRYCHSLNSKLKNIYAKSNDIHGVQTVKKEET